MAIYQDEMGFNGCMDRAADNCCPRVQSPNQCSDCIGCPCWTWSAPARYSDETLYFEFCPETQCSGRNDEQCKYVVVCADPSADNYDESCDDHTNGARQCQSELNGLYCMYQENPTGVTGIKT